MATESIGTLIPTAIPGYTDSADIQAALRAYHYGSYSYDPANTSPGSLVTPSIAKTIYDIEQDIISLENRPSSGGEVNATEPVPGDFTPPAIPDGFIWVDSDGSSGNGPYSATSIFTNSAPTANLTTGVIWVDKDPTSITVNPFIPQTIIGAKGDLVVGTANDTASVLNAGTNGFVLSANSATTSGLEWVAQDDSNAIQNSIVAAKGDIIGASANDVPAITSVGANGETLVADSSTSTGLRWQGLQAAGRNKIINGAFDFWQRGTSSTNNAGYGAADRWYQIRSTGTVTWSRSTDVPTNPYFKYSMSMAGTSIQNASIVNRMESSDSEVLAGQTVTLSFYAKSTAGSGMTMSWYTQYPGATDDWSSAVDDKNGTVTITTSWARYSVTLLASALATRGYDVYLTRQSNETSTTLITGVQLELGSVATPFTRAAGSIQQELAACQRYYYRLSPAAANRGFGSGLAFSSTAGFITMPFPVEMRIRPTGLEQSGTAGDYALLSASAVNQTCTAVPVYDGFTNTRNAWFVGTVGASLTGGNTTVLCTLNTNGYLGWSAEL